ncbi:hypothetical protein E2C01_046798 [Portunus trituberculatus]|uniref:Uncharacterized protein n=1 Tax=Portunus trituberculatus TaxID=210409 RepID=A0A5B7G5Q4_PORTR|nr:hypothetical protein [Portunus trituberculatus]
MGQPLSQCSPTLALSDDILEWPMTHQYVARAWGNGTAVDKFGTCKVLPLTEPEVAGASTPSPNVQSFCLQCCQFLAPHENA